MPVDKPQYRGAYQRKGRWWSQITVDTVSRHLGYHATALDAARAYDRASLVLLGPSATTNFPAADYSQQQLEATAQELELRAQGMYAGPSSSQRSGPGGSSMTGEGNSSLASGQPTRYNGVSHKPERDRWYARFFFTLNGRTEGRHLGSFATEEEAALARDAAALYVHGDRAELNFPRSRLTDAMMQATAAALKLSDADLQQLRSQGSRQAKTKGRVQMQVEQLKQQLAASAAALQRQQQQQEREEGGTWRASGSKRRGSQRAAAGARASKRRRQGEGSEAAEPEGEQRSGAGRVDAPGVWSDGVASSSGRESPGSDGHEGGAAGEQRDGGRSDGSASDEAEARAGWHSLRAMALRDVHGKLGLVTLEHRTNVEALMHAALGRGDYPAAAAAAATLLSAHDPDRLTQSYIAEQSANTNQARTAQIEAALAVALHLLRHAEAPTETLKRLLRKFMHLFGALHLTRGALLLQLAGLIWQQGDPSQALDVLSSQQMRRTSAQHSAQAATLQAIIRHSQWVRMMLELLPAEEGDPQQQPPPPGARATSPASVLGGSVGLGPLQLPISCTGAASALAGRDRRVKELWQEAEAALKAALELTPEATPLTLMLCQLHLVAGQPGEAAAAARASVAAAPASADAQALVALVAALAGVPRGPQQGEGGGESARGGDSKERRRRRQEEEARQRAAADALHGLRDTCASAVKADPLASGPLAEVICLAHHCPSCLAACCTALLEHLDLAGQAGGHAGCSSDGSSLAPAWQQAADALQRLARLAVAELGASDGLEGDGAALASAAQPDAGSALAAWQGVEGELRERAAWWPEVVLGGAAAAAAGDGQLPGSQVAAAAGEGGSSWGGDPRLPDQHQDQQQRQQQQQEEGQRLLGCRAVVAAYVLAGRGVAARSQPGAQRNGGPGDDATQEAPQQLQVARSALTEAQALIDRLHAWRLACAASSAVQQQAEAQPAGRLGERSAAYGAMRDLPASWWRAFRRLPARS